MLNHIFSKICIRYFNYNALDIFMYSSLCTETKCTFAKINHNRINIVIFSLVKKD